MTVTRPPLDRRPKKAVLEEELAAGRRAVLVVNTRSRNGARSYSDAKHRLTEAGLTLDATYPVSRTEWLPEIVRQAIDDGHKFIIIGGGDGTLSSIVGHFAYADAVLGLLPLGTANSFARALGIPLDLDAAVDNLLTGKVADIDLGKVNEDYFANGLSIGLPAAIGRETPHGLKKWLGRVAYAVIGANTLLTHRPFRCIVTIDGRGTSYETLNVRIASGGYQGGVLVASEANVDDGKFVVQILQGTSKWALAKDWARTALGAPFDPVNLEVLKARELTIDTVPKQRVSVDGEVVAETPMRISMARGALLVIVPRSFPDQDARRRS